MTRAHPAFLAIFLLILAPIAAAVVISMLLLFGVGPRMVFAPGRAVQSMFEAAGFHVANRVAVASTVGLVWALISAAGLVWERRRR
jgi:hypothetical protein